MPIWLKINGNQFIARYERDPRDFAHPALTARLAASLRCPPVIQNFVGQALA